jgi:hypothetical protein
LTRDFSQIVLASLASSEEFVITAWDKTRGLCFGLATQQAELQKGQNKINKAQV